MFDARRVLLPDELRVATGVARSQEWVFAMAMTCFPEYEACPWHHFCSPEKAMRSTFLQKVLICMIVAFFAACLIQWGKIFVEGADDALNAGYNKRDASSLTGP